MKNGCRSSPCFCQSKKPSAGTRQRRPLIQHRAPAREPHAWRLFRMACSSSWMGPRWDPWGWGVAILGVGVVRRQPRGVGLLHHIARRVPGGHEARNVGADGPISLDTCGNRKLDCERIDAAHRGLLSRRYDTEAETVRTGLARDCPRYSGGTRTLRPSWTPPSRARRSARATAAAVLPAVIGEAAPPRRPGGGRVTRGMSVCETITMIFRGSL
jgi:hypothetical protein